MHGDLHWNNLLRPRLGILDWELWGTGPAGTDAATLYCYSLLVPRVANLIAQEFADTLDSDDGRRALLYVTARLLSRADNGDHPDLAPALHGQAAGLLRSLAS